jgi:hypothetical protein
MTRRQVHREEGIRDQRWLIENKEGTLVHKKMTPSAASVHELRTSIVTQRVIFGFVANVPDG